MKGFLGDLLRTGWALWYWNARKARHRLAGAHGRAPCHNPSDSGRAGETGCEAVLGWREPARFRRVCPLLARRADGTWVCSVAAREVKPFWGRAFGWYGAVALGALLLAGFSVFGGLRIIGYQVSLRQLFWPPAWRELRGVQADLFVARAREAFAAGRVQEALSALGTAHELNPGNYATGMMLAQFNRAGNPVAADRLYARLLADHPARAVETARAWYLSLLARGQLATAAELAAARLVAEPEQTPAWTHALVFTARHLRQTVVLENAAAMPGVSGPVVRVLLLEAQLMRTSDAARRRQLLQDTPLPDDFPYAWVHRAERFVATGFPEDALQLLRTARDRGILRGRDLLPRVLAARSRLGEATVLEREVDELLARRGPMELGLVARHLIEHPDATLLARSLVALEQMEVTPTPEWQATGLALFCAAGVAKDKAALKAIRAKLGSALAYETQAGLLPLEGFFMGNQQPHGLFIALAMVDPISVELLYSLVNRYIGTSKLESNSPNQK